MTQKAPPARTFAFGDIHGSLRAFDKLLEVVSPGSGDLVVTLGDYVDRGDNSKGVIDRLIELRDRCQLVTIKGNHEEMMLDVIEYGAPPHSWLRYGGVDTLDSYGFVGDLSVIPASHREFLMKLRDYHETETAFFVHANYDPDLALSDQEPEVIRWLSLHQSVPGPHFSGKRALVGHTAARDGEIFDIGYLTCIDTCIYGNGWLTCLELETGRIWQANRLGQLRHT